MTSMQGVRVRLELETGRGLLRVMALAALSAVGSLAWADGKEALAVRMLPAYQAECAACHVAYPPGMLPAASWSRMMGSLDKHYGSDASLDAATVAQIGQWLQSHAGTYKRAPAAPPPEDRITRSAWFERKHRRIDTPLVWKAAAVQSAANCAACHSRAAQGSYRERELVFPKGLDERFRHAFADD